jgi:aminopeptidase YwaD
MDSVAVGQGADDDASGMAAVLECARRLRSGGRRHSIRFIGFGAEEQLSLGSHRYVTAQVQDLDRIGFACNFDAIGAHLGLSTAMCTGTPELDSYVRDTVQERLVFGEAVSDADPYQDQFWFAARDIPGIWFTRKTHLPGCWYHHSEHNSLDVVSSEQIAWTAETACEMLSELSAEEDWPFGREITPALREKVSHFVKELY